MRRILWSLLAICLAPALARAQEAEPWLPDASLAGRPVDSASEESWPRFSVRAEYLLWWLKDMPLRPVLTTGDTTDALPGAVGMPTTTVLYPNREVDLGLYSGARLSAAYRFGEEKTIGVEAAGFFLGSRSSSYTATSDGTFNARVIGRPFDNLGTGESDVSLTAYPSVAAGTARVTTTARVLGADLDGLWSVCRYRGLRIDVTGGFRYLRLYESLRIDEKTTVLPGVPLAGGDVIAVVDEFSTSNNFYGGQVGVRAEINSGGLMLEARAKVALGGTQEIVAISGLTTRQFGGGGVAVLPGGLYALSSNIGRRTKGSFAVLPEAGVNLGWQAMDCLQMRLGYSFLYLSRAARAGTQIDPGLNPNLIPTSVFYGTPGGPARPAALLLEEGFWVQGVNLGLEVRF